MRNIPEGKIVWSLKRYNLKENMWDHVCPGCRQTTPVFVHEDSDEQGRPGFSYLCEKCAQKMLAEWLRCTDRTDYRLFEHITDFDVAIVYQNQNNGEETLTITRWSQEQRRRRLQADE
ncbi:MAG: hypothetical protein E6J33_02595 [Chloroflexi bacterium]|nr:MAG: hypothetical protein E6J33_02595 [Chloroflexota bacterium]